MSQVMVGDADDEPGGDEDTLALVAAQTDPEAFAAFYRRNSSRVIGFYYRRTLCSHTSAELAAETFAQALGSVRRFDPAAGSGLEGLEVSVQPVVDGMLLVPLAEALDSEHRDWVVTEGTSLGVDNVVLAVGDVPPTEGPDPSC
jgi:hypothetical protein